MPGYLDQYGAGEDRRNRIVALIAAGGAVAIVLGALLFFLFQHHHQEAQVKQFLAAIRAKDFQTAYRIWGCTEQRPCRHYTIESLMEDWGGPGTKPEWMPDPKVLGITDSQACNEAVLIHVAVNQTRTETLWLQTNEDGIGFAPYPNCPRKNPYLVMLDRTLGKLRGPLLR